MLFSYIWCPYRTFYHQPKIQFRLGMSHICCFISIYQSLLLELWSSSSIPSFVIVFYPRFICGLFITVWECLFSLTLSWCFMQISTCHFYIQLFYSQRDLVCPEDHQKIVLFFMPMPWTYLFHLLKFHPSSFGFTELRI